jgi:hypothetical protein
MCPYLEVLCIFPPTVDAQVQDVTLDAIPQTYLPCLANYDGPYMHLLNICHQPLKHVSLWGLYERPALCDPDALTQTLSSFAERNNGESLKSLTVLVINITIGLLKSFSVFENLEHLTVRSRERDFPANRIIGSRFHISVSSPFKQKYHDIYVCKLDFIRYDSHNHTSIQPQEHQISHSSWQRRGSPSPGKPGRILHPDFRKAVSKGSTNRNIIWNILDRDVHCQMGSNPTGQ